MNANEQQVGGEHYSSQYQHWDWVIDNNLNYLEGCATKYITRWRKKNGVEDLKKAKHYIAKLIERAGDMNSNAADLRPIEEAVVFCDRNSMCEMSKKAFMHVCYWRDTANLKLAYKVIDSIIEKEGLHDSQKTV